MKDIVCQNKKETICLNSNEEYKILLDGVLEAEVVVEEHVNATLLLKIENTTDLKLSFQVKEAASLHLLHQCDESVDLEENVSIYRDADLNCGFYLLDEEDSKIKAVYSLKESGASVNVLTSVLSAKKNHYFIECVHEVPQTSSMMENYAIVKESGEYEIVASGRITKGAYGSKSHQSTRVLTMGEKENASVTPLLLIDENDVEASHACALGAMNQDHLYYLQTRGLNKTQALGLLTLSYILPLLRIVENTSFAEMLEKEIESKVGLSC